MNAKKQTAKAVKETAVRKLPAGYRWLREDEILEEGDAYWCVSRWYQTENVGRPANGAAGPYIRKVERPKAVKRSK